jgi:predicted DNA-binding transcriptional regulator AlpA
MDEGWRGAIDRLMAELEKAETLTLEEVLANLVTASQISDEHGFASDSIVYNYRTRYTPTRDPFPEPLKTFGRTDVYWRPSIDQWMERHKKRMGSLNKSEGRTH